MNNRPSTRAKQPQKCFIDLFAGCGGLSLGLVNAGWTGIFAIEKNRSAFGTLKTNLLGKAAQHFHWPSWLPKKAFAISYFLSKYKGNLLELNGQVDLIAGGPPCQGFSLAGRRIHTDPRNRLLNEYLRFVKLVGPRLIFIENVQGFQLPFKKNGHGRERNTPYSTIIEEKLRAIGYTVFSDLIDLSLFGVPQTRKRFILIAIKNGDKALLNLNNASPLELLAESRTQFLRSKRLRTTTPISAREALADLEIANKELKKNRESRIRGFLQIAYSEPSFPSRFIALMRRGAQNSPNSLRLARHKESTVRQFVKIMKTCPTGVTLNDSHRKRLHLKKQALTPLNPDAPAATVTTLPDDIIHYSEPRILCVRENARLQTFPDWFRFTGNYTTGGKDRRTDCPRYTQVGNAVPPLFSEAMGIILRQLCR
jgi:DNA (cytosine-5)-methyltransferase 1